MILAKLQTTLLASSIAVILLIAGIIYITTEQKKETMINEQIEIIEEDSWVPLLEIDTDTKQDIYAIKSLTTEASTTIDLRTAPEHDTLKINDEDVTDQTSYELTVDDISQEATISLQVDDEKYEIRTLPEALTSYDIKNEGSEDGFYYFTFHDYIVKLNTDGNIVYYNEVDFHYNFRLHKTDEGESYYSYGATAKENDKIEGVGY